MKVLLIDDEPDIRQIAQMALQVVGKLDTTTAAGALEGIAAAKKDIPDLILLDMMMPEIDGLTALGLIRSTVELKDVPVIFMTARVQRSDIDAYVAQGALGVVQKPFDPMTLAADVLRLLSARVR